MKIKTLTCHDVYNHGASLQAYALQTFLSLQGHDVEIIDYKPDYLSGHYDLKAVCNPVYDKPILRELYLLAKLPQRIKALKRKWAFNRFTRQYLRLTSRRYRSNEELKQALPVADAYFAGSDQIWNTIFRNGRDAAFYLDFVPEGKLKASYAASFGTSAIVSGYEKFVKTKIENLDYISVREKSALKILQSMNIERGIHVCDPVFLLPRKRWSEMASVIHMEKYVLVYDFEKNKKIEQITTKISKHQNVKIYSISPVHLSYADKEFKNAGPLDFLSLIKNAEYVVSNSFHATAFALIFEKNFCVVNRSEKINERLQSLLDELEIGKRLVSSYHAQLLEPIDFQLVNLKLNNLVGLSQNYLSHILNKA